MILLEVGWLTVRELLDLFDYLERILLSFTAVVLECELSHCERLLAFTQYQLPIPRCRQVEYLAGLYDRPVFIRDNHVDGIAVNVKDEELLDFLTFQEYEYIVVDCEGAEADILEEIVVSVHEAGHFRAQVRQSKDLLQILCLLLLSKTITFSLF